MLIDADNQPASNVLVQLKRSEASDLNSALVDLAFRFGDVGLGHDVGRIAIASPASRSDVRSSARQALPFADRGAVVARCLAVSVDDA